MKKVSKTKIASIYANALYEAAVQTNALDEVAADAAKLGELAAADASLVKFLANPLYGLADKKSLLAEIAQKLKWNIDTLRCMDVIADNGRFKELPLILDEFKQVYNRHAGIVEVNVETVKKLSAAQDKRLRANLENRLQKKVAVVYRLNPEIIGGLRIKFGSEMIDNTLISKLNRLGNIMKGE